MPTVKSESVPCLFLIMISDNGWVFSGYSCKKFKAYNKVVSFSESIVVEIR